MRAVDLPKSAKRPRSGERAIVRLILPCSIRSEMRLSRSTARTVLTLKPLAELAESCGVGRAVPLQPIPTNETRCLPYQEGVRKPLPGALGPSRAAKRGEAFTLDGQGLKYAPGCFRGLRRFISSPRRLPRGERAFSFFKLLLRFHIKRDRFFIVFFVFQLSEIRKCHVPRLMPF